MAQREGSGTIRPNAKRAAVARPPPSFVKTFQSFNLRSGVLELPAKFVKKYWFNSRERVKLRGPGGQTSSVYLHVPSNGGQHRVHFHGAEWRAFVFENGFKVGHQLVFSLISMSLFAVDVLENSASVNKDSASGEHRSDIPNSSTRTESRNSTKPSANVNEVVYTNGTWKYKADVEALVENVQCPHFVKLMTPSNLFENRSSALSVPKEFMKRYGKHFTQVQYLRGPSGSLVKARFSPGTVAARFTTGWKTFCKVNRIREGDVLLFSLQAPACWLVQVVGNGRSESPETRRTVQPERP